MKDSEEKANAMEMQIDGPLIRSVLSWLRLGRVFLLILFPAILCASMGRAQSNDTIQVNVREVTIPVFVVKYALLPNAGSMSDFLESHTSEVGLTAKDFHIYDNDLEQIVTKVSKGSLRVWDVRDNVAHHCEMSTENTAGIWSGADLWPGKETEVDCQDINSEYFYYYVSYTPSLFDEKLCHKIKVKVDRTDVLIRSRKEYCNTSSPTDPLNGTEAGKRLERFAGLDKAGDLHLNIQAGVLFLEKGQSILDIAVDIPSKALFTTWHAHDELYAEIAMLGVIYRKDGLLERRFSDLGCCSDGYWNIPLGSSPSSNYWYRAVSRGVTPTHYEQQVNLPAGDYELQMALTDSYKYGKVEIPVHILKPDSSGISVSSVLLCKRFHQPTNSSWEERYRPRTFQPLVSKGIEFSPTGDTRFRKGDALIAFFELYDPRPGAAQALSFTLRVSEMKTGKTVIDTGKQDATSWMQSGNPVTAIAQKIAVDRLPHGSYRITVQGFGREGSSTSPSTTDFTVE